MKSRKKSFSFWVTILVLNFIPLIASGKFPSNSQTGTQFNLKLIQKNIKDSSKQSPENFYANLMSVRSWKNKNRAKPSYNLISPVLRDLVSQASSLEKRPAFRRDRNLISRAKKLLQNHDAKTFSNKLNLAAQEVANDVQFSRYEEEYFSADEKSPSRTFSKKANKKVARHVHFEEPSVVAAPPVATTPMVAAPVVAAPVVAAPVVSAPAAPAPVAAAEPAPAPVADAAPVIPFKGNLKPAQLEEAFFDFSIRLDGPNPSNKAVLTGLVFEQCKDKFQFKQETAPKSNSCSNSVGFRIDDIGGGRQCVAKLKAEGKTCESDGQACQRLSTRADSSLDLKPLGNVNVKLVFDDFTKDSERLQCVDFPGHSIVHKTASAMAQEKREEEDEIKRKRIAVLEHQFRSCRGSEDDLALAQSAIEGLRNINAIDSDLFDRRENELTKAHFALLEKRIHSAHTEDLPELRESFLSWASDHPEDNQKCVMGLHKIALRYTSEPGATPEAFDFAHETLAESISIADSRSVRRQLEHDQFMTKVGRLSVVAQQGLANNRHGFLSEFKSISRELHERTHAACERPGASQEECANILQLVDRVGALPSVAQKVDQRNAEFRQQLQQRINQAGNPMNQQQNQGNQGFNPMGMNPMSMNPMGGMMNSMYGGGFGINPMMDPYGAGMYGGGFGMNPMGGMNPMMSSMYGGGYGMSPMMNGMFGGMRNPIMGF